MKKNRIKTCFITGTRAEYGLLKHLMKKISKSPDFIFNLVVTGSHLSNFHGETINEIKNDGFQINQSINMELKNDSSHSTCKSLSILIEKLSIYLDSISPDIIVILGDRYELLGVAAAALIHNIPIAHIQGGEITEGAFDEKIRHSITKLSHLHFVTTELHRKRIIQLGEKSENIYNVGSLGVDAIKKTKILNQKDLEKNLKIKFLKKNFLITYHPVTLESIESTTNELRELLEALSKHKEALQIFTMPNADPGNNKIYELIQIYVKNNNNAVFFKSLGQLRYYSCLNYIDGILGNSSSGIIEAPSFGIGTINIGDRQKGRTMAKSIINTKSDSKMITKSICKLYSEKFQNDLKKTTNPYEGLETVNNIISKLKETNYESLSRKRFFDVEFK